MLSKDKTSFVLYTSFYDALQDLPLDRKGMLLDLIFKYEIYGDTDEFEKHFADLPNDVKMAFRFIKGQLDKDQERWRDVCSKRAEAGRLSGEIRRKQSSKCKVQSANVDKKQQSLTKRTNVDFVQQTRTKRTEYEYDNEYDTHKCVCDNARARVSGTHTRKIKQSKFFVPGRTDGDCQSALETCRKFDTEILKDMFQGNPRDFTLKGDPIWVFDEQMDKAAAFWVLVERGEIVRAE